MNKRKEIRDRYEQKLEIKPSHFTSKAASVSNTKSFNTKAEQFKALN